MAVTPFLTALVFQLLGELARPPCSERVRRFTVSVCVYHNRLAWYVGQSLTRDIDL